MAKRKDSKGNELKPYEYERKDQEGYIYKWQDSLGKWCSVSDVTLKGLREKEKIAKIGQLQDIPASKQRDKINDYFAIWLQHKKRSNLKPNVLSNYVYMYDKFIRNTLGRKQIVKVRKSDIKKFYDDLLDDGLSVSTVDSGINTVLRQVFAVAYDDDIIRKNPCDGVMKDFKYSEKKKKPRALTDKEEHIFMDAIRGTQWECVFGVALRTGMRVAELSALKWDDIDWDKKLIHVQRNFVYYRDNVNQRHKGDKKMERRIQSTKSTAGDRFLKLSDEIEGWLNLYKEIGNKNIDNIDGETGFIFATRDGMCYNQNSLNRALKRIVAQVNASAEQDCDCLPDMHMHMLRKSFITDLAKSGVPLVVAGRLAGHSPKDLETTASVYTEVQESMINDADRMLQEYLHSENSEKNS